MEVIAAMIGTGGCELRRIAKLPVETPMFHVRFMAWRGWVESARLEAADLSGEMLAIQVMYLTPAGRTEFGIQ